MNKKNINWCLLAILVIAVLVRLVALNCFHDYPHMAGSVVVLGEIARNIYDGNGFQENVWVETQIIDAQNKRNKIIDFEDVEYIDDGNLQKTLSMPGYSILLATTWHIFGEKRYIYLQIIQVILDILCLLMIYSIARRVFSENVAKISSFAYALFLPTILLIIAPFRNGYPLFASVVITYLLFNLFDNKKNLKLELKTYVLIGLIIGVSVMIRETLFALPIAIGLVFAYLFSVKKALKAFTIISIAYVAVMLPWTLMKYNEFGKFIPLSTAGGHGLYIGFGEFPNKYNISFNDNAAYNYVLSQNPDATYLGPEYDAILKKESVRLIKDDPLGYGSMVLKRMYRGFFLRNRPQAVSSQPQYNMVRSSALLLLSILAIFGAWAAKKKDAYKMTALIMIPTYFVFLYAPLNMDLRHVLPGAWVYIIFASFIIERFFTKIITPFLRRNGIFNQRS